MRTLWTLLGLTILQLISYLPSLCVSFMGVDSRGVYLLDLIMGSQGLFRDILHFALALLSLHLLISIVVLAHFQMLRGLVSKPRLVILITVLWAVLFNFLLILLNTIDFRHSAFALSMPAGASVGISLMIMVVAVLLVAPTLIWLARSRRGLASGCFRQRKYIPYMVALFFWGTVFFTHEKTANAVTSNQTAPNIVIIGVDSFSRHQLLRYSSAAHFRELVDGGVEFEDVITPLGRTFPSWVSIFTGKYPIHNGARFNLTSFDMLPKQAYLPETLKSNGYQTIYAMDERRFSNVDSFFGFDSVVGPSVGAADFIVSKISDLPIVNLVAKFPGLGKTLFPFVYANRGRGQNYDPQEFDDELESAIGNRNKSKPLFLTTHFCLAHVPFEWVGSNPGTGEFEPLHEAAISAVTDQVQHLLDVLKREGVLNNAHVVFLSDHGEGVLSNSAIVASLDNSMNTPGAYSSSELSIVDRGRMGHGTNLLDRDSTDPLLFFLRYRNGQKVVNRAKVSAPVSMIDIAPTILEMIHINGKHYGDEGMDGSSLALLMSSETALDRAKWFYERPRFMETDLYFSAMGDTVNVDEKSLIDQARKYYTVSDSGRLQLRKDTYPLLVSQKNRSVILDGWQLTAIPLNNPDAFVTVLSKRQTQQWTLDLQSDWSSKAPLEKLVRELKRSYNGELASWDPLFVNVGLASINATNNNSSLNAGVIHH